MFQNTKGCGNDDIICKVFLSIATHKFDPLFILHQGLTGQERQGRAPRTSWSTRVEMLETLAEVTTASAGRRFARDCTILEYPHGTGRIRSPAHWRETHWWREQLLTVRTLQLLVVDEV